MSVRKAYRGDTSQQWKALYRRRRGRIYVLWLIGAVIGIIQLQPTSVNAGGVTFSIGRPEIIQGALYLACLVVWFDTIATILVKKGMINRSDQRDAIFAALKRHKRSFRSLEANQLKEVQSVARRILMLPVVVSLIEVSIPIVFVAAFGLRPIWQLVRTLLFGL